MINLLISGANGRMGKKVYEASINADGITAVCGIDIKDDFTFSNYPVYARFENVKENINVVVDFSAPSNLDNVLSFCLAKGIPAVLCATGYTQEQIDSEHKFQCCHCY